MIEIEEAIATFKKLEFDIHFTRTFDGQKFAMLFTSPHFGTCGAVQTDEEKALDGALALLKRRLAETIAEARKK